MANRIKLHEKLCNFLESNNVYFQPPSNTKLNYPCIIYELSDISTKHSNNSIYLTNHSYQITYIDKNPDSSKIDLLFEIFPKCKFNRHFVNDNLHHYVYIIYY